MCVCVHELVGDRRGGEILRLDHSADDARCQHAISAGSLSMRQGQPHRLSSSSQQQDKEQAAGSGVKPGKEGADLLRSAESSKLPTQPGLLRAHCRGQQENREWGRYPSHTLVRSKGGFRANHEGHQCRKLRTYQGCCLSC